MLMCATTGLVAGTQIDDANAEQQVIVADPATNRAMWDVQFFLDIGVITGSTGLAPVGFDGTYWFCPEWNSATIHQFDKDGANHVTFTIPGVSAVRDIEYDGTYFYGGNAAGLFLWQMDFTAHTLVSTITLPVAARSCAYDADNDGFWVNVWTTDLICFSRTGTELNRITAPESLYGCAWDGTTQISGYAGPFLWVSTGTSSGVDEILKCYDIATKALTTTTHNVAQELGLGIAGGLVTTPDYEAGTLTLAGCCQATSDYIFAYEVSITNAPPATPGAPTGPTSGNMGTEYTFSASTTDPEGDDVQFMFDWGDGNFSEWTTPSSGSGSAAHAWYAVGSYEIKVKAKDAVHGGESDWSPAHTMTILAAPVLKVEWIRGGLFKVSASIKNVGGVPANNTAWTITLTGGAFIGKETTGTVDLGVGIPTTIKSGFILGFGATVVKVTLTHPESSATKEVPGKVLLFFIKI